MIEHLVLFFKMCICLETVILYHDFGETPTMLEVPT